MPSMQNLTRAHKDAIEILECIDAHGWHAIHALSKDHVTGRLSYEAWHCGVTALVVVAAHALEADSR